MRRTILRIANLPRSLLENRKKRKEAKREAGAKRRKHSAKFWAEVDRIMNKYQVKRYDAIEIVNQERLDRESKTD